MLELFDRCLNPSLQILSELHIGHFNTGGDRRNMFQTGLTLGVVGGGNSLYTTADKSGFRLAPSHALRVLHLCRLGVRYF